MRFFVLLFLFSPVLAWSDPAPPASAELRERFRIAQSFSCTGKTCGQMSSCAEACHALLVCGDGARDRDKDGIPCESLCGNTRC